MERTYVEAIEDGVGTKAQICTVDVMYKLRLTELAFVGKFGVSGAPMPLADLARQVFHCRLRRGGWTQETRGSRIRKRSSRLVGMHDAEQDQCSRNEKNRNGEQPSAPHIASLPGSRSSTAEASSGRSPGSRSRSAGINRTNRAKRLLPKGSVPHINPCQRGGSKALFTGTAGGVPSLLQTVIVLSSSESTLR